MRVPPVAVVLFIANASLATLLYTLVVVLDASLRRVEITGIRIFRLPIARFVIRGIPVSIGILPLDGSVSLRDAGRPGRGRRLHGDLHPIERAALPLAAPLALLVISALCLGGSPALNAFLSTFPHLLHGIASPIGYTSPRIAAYFHATTDAPWLFSFGVIAAKFAALNTLPLPGLTAGGSVPLELIRLAHPTITQQPAFTRLVLPSLLLLLTLYASLAIAFCHAVF